MPRVTGTRFESSTSIFVHGGLVRRQMRTLLVPLLLLSIVIRSREEKGSHPRPLPASERKVPTRQFGNTNCASILIEKRLHFWLTSSDQCAALLAW